MKTSLIIPCFNERDGIAQLCERLRALVDTLGDDVEIVFVDDGSTDGTEECIHEHAMGLPYSIVTHQQNRGIAAALTTGFENSSGDELVTLDSDCTYDPDQVPALLSRLREGFDVVTASPYHPEGQVVGVVTWRLFLSKGLSRLYWLLLPKRLHTYTSCFRASRREVSDRIRPADPGFLGVAQFLIESILQGFRVTEMPAVLQTRRFGQSKIRVVQVILAHLRYLIRLLIRRLLQVTGREVEVSHSTQSNEHPHKDACP